MQSHEFSWIVEAPRAEVWAVLHPQREIDPRKTTLATPRIIAFGNVRIEVIAEGDANGQGLVRRTWFRAPWYTLSRGMCRSWEFVSEVRWLEYACYRALLTPFNAHAIGWHRMDDLGGGRTRVTFHEDFEIANPVLRFFFEKRMHRFLSKDNDKNLPGLIEAGLKANRAKAQAESQIRVAG